MRRIGYWLWAVAAAGLFAAAVGLAVRTLADARSNPEMYYNADFLTPAALYDDLVLDGYPLRGFKFSAANFAFPDVLSYFAVRAVVGSTAPAFLLWLAVLLGLVAAGGATAAAVLAPAGARRHVGPAVLCVLAMYLGCCAAEFFGGFARDLFLPVSHTGALAVGLFGVAAVAAGLRAKTRGRTLMWALLLAVLTAATTFSDRLFALYFCAPVVAALGVIRLTTRPDPAGPLPVTWGTVAWVTAALAVGTALAVVVLKRVQGSDDPIDGYWSGVTWDGAAGRVGQLAAMIVGDAKAGNVLVIAALVWYARSLLRGVLWLTRRVRRLPRGAAEPAALYELFCAGMLVAVVGVFVLSRASVYLFDAAIWPDFSRYFVGPFGAALFGWPLAVATAVGTGGWFRRTVAILGPLAIAVGCVALATGPRAADYDLRAVYPSEVREVDAVCRKWGLRDGLAGYWPSKRTTLLSREGVRVRQVSTDPAGRVPLVPHEWLSNAAWYWRPPARDPAPVRYTFVLTMDVPEHRYELPTAGVVAAFGEPAARDRAGKYVVLIYNRPTDTGVQRFHEWDATLACRRYDLERVPPLRLTPAGLGGETGRVGPDGEREAIAGRDRPGTLALGPYWRPPGPGRYTATYRVMSSDAPTPNGTAAVLLTDLKARTTTPLGGAEIPAGSDGEVRVTFDLPRLPPHLVLETHLVYAGTGRLVLRHVDLTPP